MMDDLRFYVLCHRTCQQSNFSHNGVGVRQKGLEGSAPYSDLRLSIIIFIEFIFRCLNIHNSINGSQNQDERGVSIN